MLRAILWDFMGIPVRIGDVRHSYMTDWTVRPSEVKCAVERHLSWDWGEVSWEQARHNDRKAILGRGPIHSRYTLQDGRRLHVATCLCRCGRFPPHTRTTLIILSQEIDNEPCECLW